MRTGQFLGALLCILPGLALAEASAPPIPDTPAGHALAAWLDAYNSGDNAKFAAFEQAHAPWMSLDREKEGRALNGGFDLVSIEGSGKLWVVFHAKDRASAKPVFGNLVVRSNDPEHISLLGIAPADVKSREFVLDEAERARVIAGAARLLEEFSLFPEVGKSTAAKLKAQQKRGDYRGITDGEVFAVRLEDDLHALSGDKHYGIDFFPKAMPPQETLSRPHPDPKQMAAINCGFEKADHYPPNIGYLKLNIFAEPDVCSATAIAAMNFLADSDILIIDLRDNHGGAPHMVALLSSYLFDEPTHLDDVYDRGRNTTEQIWTFPYLPGKKLTGKAVYVLTSNRTFSAGEEFSYDLKSLERVTVIGATTGGGAHLVARHEVDEHFFFRLPFGRFINPFTKTDGESTGVEPDINVAAPEGLDEAVKRARGGS